MNLLMPRKKKKHIVNKKSKSYVKYNCEDIPVDYKTDINLDKNNSKNSPSNEIPFSASKAIKYK